MNNPLFNMKSVLKRSFKANVRAGSGAETKSFGSTTLALGYITYLKRQGSESVSNSRIRIRTYQIEKQYPDPYGKGLDPEHRLRILFVFEYNYCSTTGIHYFRQH
jgi:hypothetical protein